jgi:hypothetical protein
MPGVETPIILTEDVMPTFVNDVTGEVPAVNAIEGVSEDGRGLLGSSVNDYGLRAHSTKSAGIRGSSAEGRGVEGWATDSEGVVGISTNGSGVWGQAGASGTGVVGTSKNGVGVAGASEDPETGVGVLGRGGRVAGRFEGDVEVTGKITVNDIFVGDKELLGYITNQIENHVGGRSSLDPFHTNQYQALLKRLERLEKKVGIQPVT